MEAKSETNKGSIIAIIGIIATMITAFLGAAYGAQIAYGFDLQKSELHEKNVAQAIYTDLDSMDATLKGANEDLQKSGEKDRIMGYHTFYPENGLYYSYQTEIASLDYPLAKNITRFYSSLSMAEQERKEMVILMDDLSHTPENSPNNTVRTNILQKLKLDAVNRINAQIKSELKEAIRLQPIIKKQLEEKYKINPSP